MYLFFLKTCSILLLASSAFSFDNVSDWLSEMGCDDLLITYLEDSLQHGSQQERFIAANELADVYKRLLSLDKYRDNTALLQRATALLKNNKQVGTTALRVQLLRARYMASEQLLENYRLRYVKKSEAVAEVKQLKEIAKDLVIIRKSLLTKLKRSSERTDLYDLIGMTTSLLAWSNYYIAWFDNQNIEAAHEAEQYFAFMIQAEQPTLAQISFDLKSKEYGARAILGIALCKEILFGSGASEPFFQRLQEEDTFDVIRSQIPMWKYFLAIQDSDWPLISDSLASAQHDDRLMYARLAAVHALESPHDPKAKELAQEALALLIELDQLAMISEIVSLYGFEELPGGGFITNYILGDLAYRKLTDKSQIIEPVLELTKRNEFRDVAQLFLQATISDDIHEFTAFINDCFFMLGLSLYHASDFEQASEAFQAVSTRQNDEDSLWMAIVSLDHIQALSPSLKEVKIGLIKKYRSQWPLSARASSLLVRDASNIAANPTLVSDLLSVPTTDPNYHASQIQAASHLYSLWSDVHTSQVSHVGNKYLSVALQLLLKQSQITEKLTPKQKESLLVISLRILEISLHQQLNRKAAAVQALETIERLRKEENMDLRAFEKEITYRNILYMISKGEADNAIQASLSFILEYPNDLWTLHAAKSVLRLLILEHNEISNRDFYTLGIRVLTELQDEELASEQYLSLVYQTSIAGYELAIEENEEFSEVGMEALRIARLLIAAYPKTNRILELNAMLEQTFGDQSLALSHWRAVSSGSSKGGDQWLQARYNLMQLLSTTDLIGALSLLDQHELLYPDYGTEPYGSKLRTLHVQLKAGADGLK